MSIDFEKCFDRIKHSAIRGCLNYFNFGPHMTEWIMILYKEFYLSVQNNGEFTDWFTVSRGVFQGNLIASYLYLLSGETLSNLIRSNEKYQRNKNQ